MPVIQVSGTDSTHVKVEGEIKSNTIDMDQIMPFTLTFTNDSESLINGYWVMIEVEKGAVRVYPDHVFIEKLLVKELDSKPEQRHFIVRNSTSRTEAYSLRIVTYHKDSNEQDVLYTAGISLRPS